PSSGTRACCRTRETGLPANGGAEWETLSTGIAAPKVSCNSTPHYPHYPHYGENKGKNQLIFRIGGILGIVGSRFSPVQPPPQGGRPGSNVHAGLTVKCRQMTDATQPLSFAR